MSAFKQRLRKLLNDTIIHNDTNNDLDTLVNTTRSLLYRNNSMAYISVKKKKMEHNKSYSNLNRSLYTNLFSIEKFKHESSSSRVSCLVRSCTLRDIHNYLNTTSLSRSMSTINIEESDRSNYKIRRKIESAKRELSNEIIRKKININKPIVALNANLLQVNKKDILKLSPINGGSNGMYKKTRRYINFPMSKNKEGETKKYIKEFTNGNKTTRFKRKYDYIKINL